MSDGSNRPSNKITTRPPSAGAQRKPNSSYHFVAGLASGLSTSIILQPADLLKTRVQQSRSSSLLPVLRSILSSPHPVRSLWRGTLPSAVRTGFGSALYFTSLSALRQRLSRSSTDGSGATGSSVLPKLSNAQNLATGAAARVFAGLIIMPVTVIKVRYESDLYAYKSLVGAMRDIVRREGLRGFFTGFGATAVRDAPYAGLYVVFYEWSKKQLNLYLNLQQPMALTSASASAPSSSVSSVSALTAASINFGSGMFAAGVATSVTNPFDAVKTRLQLMPAKYGNMVKAARTMLREDGVRSFFDGLGLRMSRKALSSALAWTVYEELIGRGERRFARDRAAAAGNAL